MANGTDGWCMAKAKKAKPREKLPRWRVSLIKVRRQSSLTSRWPQTRQVAEEHRIPDTLRDRLVAIREDL
jgi:hypothetical protein